MIHRFFSGLAVILSLGALSSCDQDSGPKNDVETKTSSQLPSDVPCALSLRVESDGGSAYRMIGHLNFHHGSYVISPTDSAGMKGKFQIHLGDSVLFTNEAITEWPPSSHELEYFQQVQIQVARNPTMYAMPFEVLSDSDFETSGHALFVLEPSCIAYILEFQLIQKEGNLTFTSSELQEADPQILDQQ